MVDNADEHRPETASSVTEVNMGYTCNVEDKLANSKFNVLWCIAWLASCLISACVFDSKLATRSKLNALSKVAETRC